MINILFTNFCILVTFLYVSGLLSRQYVTGFDSPSRSVKLCGGVLFGIYGIILMYYSFPIDPRFFADLRHLAIIVIASYLGWLPSLVAGLLMAVGRVLLFGMTGYSAAAGAGMLVIGMVCGLISLARWDRLTKMMTMSIASMLVLFFVISSNIPDRDKVFSVFTQHLIISLLATLVIYMLTEYIHTSNKLFLQLKKYAETDYLTSLNNLRQFEQLLSERFLEAQHFSERLGVLMIDIDHFKKINDTYGHAAGDAVLQQLSKVLKDNSRSFDEVSRNGGEEFSVLVPEATITETTALAERIRAAVERHAFTLDDGTKLHITISVGVAVHPDTIRSREARQLMEQADQELYRAKNNGRNRVCSAPEIHDYMLG
ncbi:diguanylate cyclase [Paenibacillus ihbetae]|uniref:Diguanylate cyclase n=1 Tax=Paenibacillus ihbetae TaxID=1870820 RepID=A0A1B2E201_9BACL|nr:diguanylate cyclase [Paenibacillus ihbetae]ANY73959.1 diguanylate cyclase [Paenibacillus ihbetae]